MGLMTDAGLSRKFLIVATVGLTTLSLILLALSWAHYRHQLTQERGQAAAEVNLLLQAALENAMLKRDLPGLNGIVERLGQQAGIRSVVIVAPNREVRFASDAALLGQRFPLEAHGICLDCPDAPQPQVLRAAFTVDAQGREVMRSVNPVANKSQCAGCHGDPAANPVNGVLVVDYDAAPIRHRAAQSAAMLAAIGALMLGVTLTGGGWFIRRHILLPVKRLSDSSQALAAGHLDSRVELSGNDELSQLGTRFNEMAVSLEEQMLRIHEQEAFLQAMVDAFPDGIRVIDPDTFAIALDNRAYRKFIGQDPDQPCRGQTCHASSHGRATPCPPSLTLCPVHEIRRNGQPCKTLMNFRQADGGTQQVEVIAAPMQIKVGGVEKRYVVESCRDLARLVKYSQEQKLAEIAQLATGVAHEIHNPLASVRIALHATLRAAEQNIDRNSEIRTYLKLVDGEVDRCIKITERLLKLGTAAPSSAQLVEVNPAVAETLSLLMWEAEADNVAIRSDNYAQPTPRVMASDSELRMVVLNLVQNALHAMPGGGVLTVETRQQDGKVEIIFSDTGVGIQPEDAAHIFDAFFSHRADGGRGTGLGLSICQSILQNYGGRIHFESQPGAGSRFVVELPDAESLLNT